MIVFMAVNPSILGISMSIVMTSGLKSFAFSTASSPSRAVATTSMVGSVWIIPFKALRIKAESSTTKTRVRSLKPHPLLT